MAAAVNPFAAEIAEKVATAVFPELMKGLEELGFTLWLVILFLQNDNVGLQLK